MIISHLYKFVFIHSPKTAGSYTENILRQIDQDCIDIDYYENQNKYGHIPFCLIKRMDIYKDIKDYTFFTVIREPLDLIISHYNYILTCKDLHYLYNVIKDMSFEESVKIILDNNYGLCLRYIIENQSNINEINRNIILLKFDDISKNLKKFLCSLGISLDIINEINFNTITNKSNNFIQNTDDTLDINKLNIDDIKIIQMNKILYNSL